MKVQNIYMGIRIPANHLIKVIDQVQNSFGMYPGAQASLSGLSHDGDKITLTVQIVVPKSNTNPSAISAIQFAHHINESFYDYMPHHKEAPTVHEVDMLAAFQDKIIENTRTDMEHHVYV